MFAIPWHGHALIGTTDTPVDHATLEPIPFDHEIDFILDTASQYLSRRPQRSDILSVFAGIRPLVKSAEGTSTASLSRDHSISISNSGLLTIAGGKWTTYRKMAEDCVDQAATLGKLDERPCVTRDLKIHGYLEHAEELGDLAVYGSDAAEIELLMQRRPELAAKLDDASAIRAAQVVWAVQHEMARSVDDVLARRTRALLLDARAAIKLAPAVAKLMAAELGRDSSWESEQIAAFESVAKGYLEGNAAAME
jgi:glycerol-3-phosphate dehydrogenase